MSLAEDLNTGGVVDAMAARFADQDAARRAELDRLIKAGKGNVEPPWRGREGRMPKCSACGKQGHNARSCEKQPKASPGKAADGTKIDERDLPRLRSGRPGGPFPVTNGTERVDGSLPGPAAAQLEVMGVEQLLELVAAAKKELARRRDEARSLASKLETALEEFGQ